MAKTICVEVEENANCEYVPLLADEARGSPAPIARVRLFELDRPRGVYQVTGWSSAGAGSPCPAAYAPVSDSGQAEVHLICGGDWGVRLKPDGSDEDWDIASPNQWGDPYLMLTDADDVLPGG